MPGTMDIYLVQSPTVVPESDGNPDHDSPRDFLRNMLKAYRKEIHHPVKDISDFVGRVMFEYISRRKLVKKMVIGSHGSGLATGYGLFYIGKDLIMDDDDGHQKLERLRMLSAIFSPDAEVVLMACKTGNDGSLMRRVSSVLGGVKVRGYTDYVTATNYWLWASVDDETDDGSKEIVCWSGECRDFSQTDPRTKAHPKWTVGKPINPR
jgi:hypothetical protein